VLGTLMMPEKVPVAISSFYPAVRTGGSWGARTGAPQPRAGHQGSPRPEIRHHPRAKARTRLGWDMGLRVGPAQQGPWQGQTGLWGAGARPCCSISRAGADAGSWAVGQGGGDRGEGWAGAVRPISLLRAVTPSPHFIPL